VKPYERELMKIDAYRLHKQLYIYLSPLIVVVGLLGNLMSFVVLVQRPTRRISTYCYLIVLAVADTIVLTAGLLPKWIEQVRNVVRMCFLSYMTLVFYCCIVSIPPPISSMRGRRFNPRDQDQHYKILKIEWRCLVDSETWVSTVILLCFSVIS